MNIAGPIATLIFGITVLTVFGGLFAYGVYKARERTRAKPAAKKKALAWFVEYVPRVGGVQVDEDLPVSLPFHRRPWGPYLLLSLTLGGFAAAATVYYGSARRLVLQGAWASGAGSSEEFPGPPPPRRPERGPPIVLTKLANRRPSLFPKARFDTNGDGVIQPAERARLQAEVPQTILLSVDDNGHAQGLAWLLGVFQRFGVWGKATFFITVNYAQGRPNYLGGPVEAWWNTLSNENFVGLHGLSHDPGTETWSVARWREEDEGALAEIRSRVSPPQGWAWDSYVWGSRAPFLAVSNAYLTALEQAAPRVQYDASLVLRQQQPSLGPRDVAWPFSLSGPAPPELRSPVDGQLGSHAVLEVPVYAWTVRQKGGALAVVSSLDLDLFKERGCPGEAANDAIVDAFEDNLRAHYEGNRAPLHLGLHAQNYTADRRCERATIEALLLRVQQYVERGWHLQFQSMPRLLEWMAAD